MLIDWTEFDGVLFDLDGVLTPTASVHTAAWKRTFDEFLESRGLTPPFSGDDYLEYVDGKPRYDGVRDFLASRNVQLPEGDPDDPPGFDTVCALGNAKNDRFRRVLREDGVDAYPGSLALLDVLERRRMKLAVVSSSANAGDVLDAAGLAERFAVRVDGIVARAERLAGKPAPDTYLHAARLLGVDPQRAIVVEDAMSGVAAGRAGGFGLVIGVARSGDDGALEAEGADIVVSDLGDLVGPG